jgi:KamA family protein
MRLHYVTDITRVPQIPCGDQQTLQSVAAQYAFRANDYYLGLIDWNDPADPIRRLVIPDATELQEWGDLDASNEKAVTRIPGLQHKYPHTVLLLCNEVCGAYCRYCFRKRLFMNGNDEAVIDVSEGIRYIARHRHITNVLLTGGDPLLLSTVRLRKILAALRQIPHVQIIRIGSKMPAFNPWRILDDPDLQAAFREFSTKEKRIYLMAHFDHPRELTAEAVEGIDCFIRNGVICCNQNPLLAGINDDPEVLAQLFRKLSFVGCPPYYLFQGRPTAGNRGFAVPIVRGYRIFEDAKKRVSGLAKRLRFVMSHESGKIEIVGVDSQFMYLRYHRAKDPANEGRFMIFHHNPDAYWLDDLTPVHPERIAGMLEASQELAARSVGVEVASAEELAVPDSTL